MARKFTEKDIRALVDSARQKGIVSLSLGEKADYFMLLVGFISAAILFFWIILSNYTIPETSIILLY